jgi:hypothetical protein
MPEQCAEDARQNQNQNQNNTPLPPKGGGGRSRKKDVMDEVMEILAKKRANNGWA